MRGHGPYARATVWTCGVALGVSACENSILGPMASNEAQPCVNGSAGGYPCRDIKVYSDHAFVVADYAGPHGMQVVDLTQPISSVVLCDPRCL